MTVSAAELRRLLKDAEAREAQVAEETPHTKLLADLADEIVRPREIGAALARIFAHFDAAGVDLLADPKPAEDDQADDDQADEADDQGATVPGKDPVE